jgi:MinD-like ATPase involved in chromosome partitioning or flagellar assembly
MNNEPVNPYKEITSTKIEPTVVSYTYPADLTDEDVKYNVTIKWDNKTTHHKNVSDGTPLHYNNPNTLTDEEITKLADDILGYQIYGYKESGVYEFARAILKKAQEK